MTHRLKLCLFAALAVALLAGAAWAESPAAKGEPAGQAPAAADATADDAAPAETPTPAFAAGQVIHLDPATGRIAAPGTKHRADALARTEAMLNRSSDGLLQVPSPRSGIMVNLLGRFRNAAVLELGADGATGGRCVTELPATAAATDVTDEAEPAEEADHE